MKKTAKVLLLSLLTLGMAVACAGRTPKSSAPAPSSEIPSSQPGTSKEDTSNPASSSTAPDTSSTAPSSAPSSSAAPSSSSAEPSSSAAPSSTSAPSSSSEAPSSSIASTLTGITLNTDNVDKEYLVGENLSLAGLIVTANYSDGSNNPVTDYTTNPTDGTLLSTAGTVNVVVTYQTATANFNVTVSNPPAVLTGIDADATNVKVNYIAGEALDLSGLVVTANYSDGSSETVTDYTSNPANGTILDDIGEAFVFVYYQDFEANFIISVEAAGKTAWTEEEAALMAAHLYGDVLPYNGLEESIVGYDSTYDYVYIEGGAIDADGIADYADLLADDGWELYGNSGVTYGFEKEEENEDGEARMLRLYLTIEEGEFYLEAYDPFYYVFPSDFAEEVAYYYFGSEEIAPAVDAWYYEIDEDYLYIACHGEFESDDGGYSAILDEEGWDVQDEQDADGYYVAISPDARYEIAYLAIPENYVMYIYFEPTSFWNDALIAEFFEAYGFDGFEVPPFEADDAMYQFVEDEDNMWYEYLGYPENINASMYIYGVDEDDVEAYLDLLDEEGWDISQGDDGTFYASLLIDGEGIAHIEIAFDGYAIITIYAMLGDLPIAEWPADEIAAILGETVTDTVPEFEGDNNGFFILNDSYGTAVQVLVDAGTEEEAVEYYAGVLMDAANYSEYGPDGHGDMQYLSPNGQIIVCPYFGTTGSITISFKKFNLFPVADVNAAIKNVDSSITDIMPGIDGANRYGLYTDDPSYIQVQCDFGGEDAADAAAVAYAEILEDAGFEYGGLDASGNAGYNSPNGQFYVVLWVTYWDAYGSYFLILNVYPGEFTPAVAGWPIEDITAMIGADLAAVLVEPSFADDYVFGVESSDYADFIIYTSTGSVEVTNALIATYLEDIAEEDWEENGYDTYGDMHYKDKDGLLDINPTNAYGSGSLFVIEVNVIPQPTPWPTDAVAAFLAEHGVEEDVLPPLLGSSYEISDNYNYANAVIMVKGISNPSAAGAAYEAILIEELWEKTGVSSGQNVYTSPNEEMTVSLWVRSDSIYMEINWLKYAGTPTIDWPADDVAAFLLENGGVTDELPAFPGLTEIGYDDNYSWGDVGIYCYCDDPSAMAEEYEGALLEAEWELTGESYGQNVYTSPSGQMTVSPYIQTSYGRVTLEITFLEPEPPVEDNWPEDEIEGLFEEFGFDGAIPVFPGEYVSATASSDENKIIVDVVLDENADFDEAVTAYCIALEDAYFDYFDEDEDGVHYVSLDEEYEVIVGLSETGIYIWVREFVAPGDKYFDTFPMDLIVSYYPEAEDVLPSLNGGDSYRVSATSDQDYFELYVSFSDEEDANEAAASFITGLVTIGFTEIDIWGSDGYLSPDGSYAVIVYDVEYDAETGEYILPVDILTSAII